MRKHCLGLLLLLFFFSEDTMTNFTPKILASNSLKLLFLGVFCHYHFLPNNHAHSCTETGYFLLKVVGKRNKDLMRGFLYILYIGGKNQVWLCMLKYTVGYIEESVVPSELTACMLSAHPTLLISNVTLCS